MAFYLGSFAGGLWQGASSAMALSGAYQNYVINQQNIAAGQARLGLTGGGDSSGQSLPAIDASQPSTTENLPSMTDVPTTPQDQSDTTESARHQGAALPSGPDYTGAAPKTTPAKQTASDKAIAALKEIAAAQPVDRKDSYATGQTNPLATPPSTTTPPAAPQTPNVPLMQDPSAASVARRAGQTVSDWWNRQNVPPTSPTPATPQQIYGGPGAASPAPATPQQMYGGVGPPSPVARVPMPSPAPAPSPTAQSQTGMGALVNPPPEVTGQQPAPPPRPAPVPAPAVGVGAPTPQAAAQPQSVGGRILSAIGNAIVPSAHAEEPPPASPTGAATAAPSPPAAGVGGGGAGPAAPAAPAPEAAKTEGEKPAGAPAPPPKAEAAGVTKPGPISTATKVAPEQKGPSTESEPTPKTPPAPAINPTYWDRLQQQDPQLAQIVQQVVDREGKHLVTVQQVAAHMFTESQFNRNVANGTSGEIGLMQVMPDTARTMGVTGDLRDPTNNVTAAVRYLAQLGEQYGANTVQANLGYMRGTGGVYQAAQNVKGFYNDSKNAGALRGMRLMYGDNFDLYNQGYYPGGGSPHSTQALVNAGNQSPELLLNEIAHAGPPNVGMSSKWQMAQAQIEAAAIMRGNYAALPQIGEWFAQMSHQGALANMSAALLAMDGGDGASAAKALARAHAFFPDGSAAVFGVDKKTGNVWAQNYSEQTHQPIGQPFQITREALQGQMLSLSRPANYVDAVNKMRLANAQIDQMKAHAQYYQGMEGFKQAQLEETTQHHQAEEALRQQSNDLRQQLADQKAANVGEHVAQEETDRREVNKQISKEYEPDAYSKQGSDAPKELLTKQAQVDTLLRKGERFGGGGMDGVTAREAAGNLVQQKWTLKEKQQSDGTTYFALTDKDGNEHGYLTRGAAEQILGRAGGQRINPAAGPQQRAAVGVGGGSQMAMMQGMNQNLSGVPMTTPAPYQQTQPATSSMVA